MGLRVTDKKVIKIVEDIMIKFNKEIGNVIDAMRARGVVNEEDAQTMQTIYKQGWLGTTALGAKLL